MSKLNTDLENLERLAKFPKGISTDPTQNMTPEQKAKWEDANEEYGDKFKKAEEDGMAELAALDLELAENSLPHVALDKSAASLIAMAKLANIDRSANQQVAKIILSQMGGQRRLVMMTGANTFVSHNNPPGVSFKFPNRHKPSKGGNYVKITLDEGLDLYDMEFKYLRGYKARTVKKFTSVYADQLSDLFVQQTGLYLRLASQQLDRLENKAATFETGSRIPDGWDPGHTVDDPDAVKDDEGSLIPDGSGNTARRAAPKVNVGPEGMFRHRWPLVYAHGEAEDRLGYDVISFDRPFAKGKFDAVFHDPDGKRHPALIFTWTTDWMPAGLMVLKSDRKSVAEAQREMDRGMDRLASTKEARSGLYGFTKRTQGDCEASVRKVQREAQKIAKRAYGKNEKVAEFLSAHARRADSLPAQILVAALSEMGPKVASEMRRTARLEELRAQRGVKSSSRGTSVADRLASTLTNKPVSLTKLASLPLFEGVPFAKLVQAAEKLGDAHFDGVNISKKAGKFPQVERELDEEFRRGAITRGEKSDLWLEIQKASNLNEAREVLTRHRRLHHRAAKKAGRNPILIESPRVMETLVGPIKFVSEGEENLYFTDGYGQMYYVKDPSSRDLKRYKRYMQAGKTASHGNKNKRYLEALAPQTKKRILKLVADHYGISSKEALEELIDPDAEALYEYLAPHRSFAMQVYRDMQSKRLASKAAFEQPYGVDHDQFNRDAAQMLRGVIEKVYQGGITSPSSRSNPEFVLKVQLFPEDESNWKVTPTPSRQQITQFVRLGKKHGLAYSKALPMERGWSALLFKLADPSTPRWPSRMASDKEARTYGLYGYSDKVANLGLAACADIRAAAGRIAYGLHSRRESKHAKITAFLDQHCKTAECKYSRLLAASYPEMSKTAGKKYRTKVDALEAAVADLTRQVKDQERKIKDLSDIASPIGSRAVNVWLRKDKQFLADRKSLLEEVKKELADEKKKETGKQASAQTPRTVQAWLEWADE